MFWFRLILLFLFPLASFANEDGVPKQTCETTLRSLHSFGFERGPGIQFLEKSDSVSNLKSGVYVGAGQMSRILSVQIPLGTDFLLLCSGIGVINRALGFHALIHVPYEFVEDTRRALIYEALEVWGEDFLHGAEFFVVPGQAERLRAMSNVRTLEQFIMGFYRSRGLHLGGVVFAKTEGSEEQGRLLLTGGAAYLPGPMIPLRHELRNGDLSLTPMSPTQAHRLKFARDVSEVPDLY